MTTAQLAKFNARIAARVAASDRMQSTHAKTTGRALNRQQAALMVARLGR